MGLDSRAGLITPKVVGESRSDSSPQQIVLDRLPANLVEELHNYAVETQREQDEFSKINGIPPAKIDLKRTVKGRLFELLAEAEMQEDESEQAKELLKLLHNPKQYDPTGELRHGRNPDLAFVQVDENGITINGVGEVKSGKHLDRRCYSQLSDTGIRKTLEKTVEWLNRHRGQLEGWGLPALAQTEGEFNISDKFKQTLIVPRNMDISNPIGMINDRDFGDHKMFGDFLRLLRDPEKMIIKQSCFSSKDLDKMTETILPEVAGWLR